MRCLGDQNKCVPAHMSMDSSNKIFQHLLLILCSHLSAIELLLKHKKIVSDKESVIRNFIMLGDALGPC